MRRKSFVSCVGVALSVCCLSLASPDGQEALSPPDAAVATMIAEVAKDRLAETTAGLASVRTRFSPTSGCRAAGTSIYNFLSRLGLAVEYDIFRYNSPRVAGGGEGRNVVATLPGTADSERMVIVGAHYDSFSTDEFRAAPGADDNASGTAAVLEIARVLSRHRFSRTIKFVAFDAEELGLFGSEHLAEAAKSRRDVIVAVLNLDMVGSSHGKKGALAVVPDRADQWLADRFIQDASRFGIPIHVVKRVNARWARSDQLSFLAAGYSALAISEDAPDDSPHYHHPGDTADTLDMDFLTAVTRATLATLATLAGPQPPPESRPEHRQ
jgi:hypothetical protein